MDEMATDVRKGKNCKADLSPPKSLKEYCSWMSNFNPNVDGNNLEIPGNNFKSAMKMF